jgi:hypothetical protein
MRCALAFACASPSFCAMQTPPPLPPRDPRAPGTRATGSSGSDAGRWLAIGLGVAALCFLLLVGGAFWAVNHFKNRVAEIAQSGAFADTADGLDLVGPVLIGDSSRSQESRRPAEVEFRQRHYVDGYARDGAHAPALDADIRRYLDTWLVVAFGHPTAAQERETAALEERLLADPRALDPIVLSIIALNRAADDRAERRRLLEIAYSGREGSRQRPYPWFCTVVSLASTLHRNHDAARIAELDALALGLLRRAVEEGSLPASDDEILADNLVVGWGEHFFKRQADGVLSLFAEAGPEWRWLRQTLLGESHINRAWAARGSGFANTVSEQGWRGFAEELDLAAPPLEIAWAMHPERPLPAARLITVAMGRSRPADLRAWLDRAIAGQSDHRSAWSAFRWALRPRWFGSHEAMIGLADSALATERFDTEVPRQLWFVLHDLAEDEKLPPGQTVFGRPELWPRLERMFEGYLAADLPAPLAARWRTDYAVAAYVTGRHALARTQLEAIDWDPVPSRLLVRGQRLPHLAAEVAARTGRHAPEVREAESARAAGRSDRVREIYQAILADSPDERTRAWAEAQLAGSGG